MLSLNEAHAELKQFRGSSDLQPFRWMQLSPGALFVAERFGGWWLLELIAAHQLEPPVKNMAYQFWTLACHRTEEATVTCRNGSGRKRLEVEITPTDFPPPGIYFYCFDRVIHLPSEY